MTRARDPQHPLPRDPRTPRRREFLYPYEVLAADGASLTLADATLEEFAGIYQWNLSDDPQTGVVTAVQNQCWREHQSAMRHLVRLLAIGTLGVAPHQVGYARRAVFSRNSGTSSMRGRRNGCNGSGSTAMWSRT